MKPVNFLLELIMILILWPNISYGQVEDKRRISYLEQSLLINEPKDHRHDISLRVSLQDSTWLEWQQRTGELPPDFEQYKSSLYLPEPLEWNGKIIYSEDEWLQKKEWIKEQYQYWIAGKIPPPPENIEFSIVSESIQNGVTIQMIKLNFGPANKATMTFELMIPPGDGPFPVYMTQWNHRNWAQLAIRRDYIGCVYAGADDKDDTQNYQQLYPEYDFTCLMRRAWGASRVVDYLHTLSKVDTTKIAITGHSRNGKQSLWAAAFDERFAAVVTSSCGTGGVTPYRFTDPQYCTQTLDDIASNAAQWFHPRLRFFFGREDRLPVDQNLLLSLIAPRSLLIHYSVMERQLNPWTTEQSYYSAKKVYEMYKVPSNIGIFPRSGEHAVTTRDLEKCIDFLDIQFERSSETWVNTLYYDDKIENLLHQNKEYFSNTNSQAEYLQKHSTIASYEKQKIEIQKKIFALLGSEPPMVSSTDIRSTYPARLDWIDGITNRVSVKKGLNIYIGPYTAMNNHLSGYLYSPDTVAKEKIPVIIYLHPYSYNHGSSYGYESFNSPKNEDLFQIFIDNGYAVLTIDLLGCGTRIEEGADFYRRFPTWSKMGHMISDVKACVDAISFFPFLDSKNIFLVGNTLGSTVAALSGALDERISGIVAISGIMNWRKDQDGYWIKHFSEYHTLIPRLGYWRENPETAPVDFPEILSCITPRPLLVFAPELDKYSTVSSLEENILQLKSLYSLYNQEDKVVLKKPLEINRLTYSMENEIIDFLNSSLQ